MADQTRKVADNVNKYHSLLETNKKCEEMLAGANNVENFSKCTVPQLTAYIHVREFRTTQAAGTDDAWKWPNKGKLEGAQAGEDNLISRAFERRNKDIMIEKPIPPEPPASPVINTRHLNATVINVSPQQTVFTNEEKASSFLQKSSWIMQVTRSLDPTGTGTVLELSDELFTRADQLQKQLEQRLTRHCKL